MVRADRDDWRLFAPVPWPERGREPDCFRECERYGVSTRGEAGSMPW